MGNNKFNLIESYVEIFLTKIISKDDLFELVANEGISFDKNFDLEKASQFDMGMILMNDVPIDKLLDAVESLRANKYQGVKSLAEVRPLMVNLEKHDRNELAKIYLDNPMDLLVEKIIRGSSVNESSQLSKEDILFFFLHGYLKNS